MSTNTLNSGKASRRWGGGDGPHGKHQYTSSAWSDRSARCLMPDRQCPA